MKSRAGTIFQVTQIETKQEKEATASIWNIPQMRQLRSLRWELLLGYCCSERALPYLFHEHSTGGCLFRMLIRENCTPYAIPLTLSCDLALVSHVLLIRALEGARFRMLTLISRDTRILKSQTGFSLLSSPSPSHQCGKRKCQLTI